MQAPRPRPPDEDAPYTVFEVGGNNYRVVVIVRYRYKKVFVYRVMMHLEYDDWNKLYRKGNVIMQATHTQFDIQAIQVS